mmetsp:Transcript_30705/g.89095  ORF Transcript_30705/g.89095 Transcript_30705/m.89095 type:complete len:327 (+) Transcript_30705:329-1309(+)
MPAVLQGLQQRRPLKVVRWVMGEDQHVAGCALQDAALEEPEGLLGPRTDRLEALLLARREFAKGGPRGGVEVVQVQTDDLQVQLRVLLEPIHIGHVEGAQVVDVAVHLRTMCHRAASARVVMVVVVAVHAVPRHRSNELRVDVGPFVAPLGVGLGLHAVGVEGVADVDDEFHIAELPHLLVHPVGDSALASLRGHVEVIHRVPAPIANDDEGGLPRVRQHGPPGDEFAAGKDTRVLGHGRGRVADGTALGFPLGQPAVVARVGAEGAVVLPDHRRNHPEGAIAAGAVAAEAAAAPIGPLGVVDAGESPTLAAASRMRHIDGRGRTE